MVATRRTRAAKLSLNVDESSGFAAGESKICRSIAGSNDHSFVVGMLSGDYMIAREEKIARATKRRTHTETTKVAMASKTTRILMTYC
jgi:hypothetical protein